MLGPVVAALWSNNSAMRTEPTILKNLAWGAPVLLSAMFFVQCSSNDATTDPMKADGAVGGLSDPTVTAEELNTEVNASYAEHEAAITAAAASVAHTAYTPAKERLMASNDMRGLRGLLVADLEAVRLRLKDGARPAPVREADQALAADLAQGLERVDRALIALGAADDATWASTREVRLNEVAEVRAWMADYRAKDDWTMN